MVATTNVDGSNPGPNSSGLPDTVQMPTGNVWKIGRFALVITPAALANQAASGVQTFAATGIGLLATDTVVVTPPSTTAGITQGAAYVSASDTLAIQFANTTAGSLTPPAGTAAAPYLVTVFRVQPNWTAPASGNQLDW